MKTILLEKAEQTTSKKIDIDLKSYKGFNDILFAIFITLSIIIGCLFINPLIVFIGMGVFSSGIYIYQQYQELKNMIVPLDDDLLSKKDIEEFKEAYEKII